MLIYSYMKDPFHTSLRMAQIIVENEGDIEKERLEIYDFACSAPYILSNSTLPQTAKKLKKFKRESKESYSGFQNNAKLFFGQKNVQETALRLMLGYDLICKDQIKCGKIKKTESGAWENILEILQTSTSIDKSLISALSEELKDMPISGKNGIKSRFKVMEHKYDSI